MSELRNIEGSIQNEEESEINIVSPGEETEINYHFYFEEETLQITDVHALEHTVKEDQDHRTAELSSTSTLWTSIDSSASPATPGIDITYHGANLQAEFAALGLNSLYPMAGQELDTSFEVSLEKNTSPGSMRKFISKNDIEEVYEVHQTSYERIVEESQVKQSSSDEVLKESHAMEEVKFEDTVIKETHHMQQSTIREIVTNMGATEGSKFVDGFKDNSSDQILEDMQAMKDNVFGRNVGKEHALETSGSKNVFKETNSEILLGVIPETKGNSFENETIKETNQVQYSISEDVQKETHRMDVSIFKEIVEKIHTIEGSMSKDDVIETYHVHQSSSEGVTEEIYAMKESKFENDFATGTHNLQQPDSEENTHKKFETNIVTEMCQMQLSISTEVGEETHVMEGSTLQSNCVTLTPEVHRLMKSNEVAEQTDAMKECVSESGIVMESQELQTSRSEDVLEETHTLEESKIKNGITTETNQVQQYSSEEVLERTDSIKECTSKSGIVIELQQLQQSSSEDVLDETHTMKGSNFKSNFDTETCPVQKLSSAEDLDENDTVKEYIYENDFDLRSQKLQLLSSEDVTKQAHQMKEGWLNNDIVTETHQVQQFSSEGVVKHRHAMEESKIQSDITTETNQHQQLSSDEVIEQANAVKEIRCMSENDIVMESQQLQITSSEDALEETNVVEESKIQRDITTGTNQHLQLSYEEVIEQTGVIKEYKSENDFVMESQKLQISSSEDILEETNVTEVSKIQSDITIETNQLEQLSSEEVIDQTNAVKDDDNRCISENYSVIESQHSEDAPEESNVIGESKIQRDISTGTNQHLQLSSVKVSEQSDVVKKYMSENDFVMESQKLQISSSEEVLEETNVMEESKIQSDITTETNQHKQLRFEEVSEQPDVKDDDNKCMTENDSTMKNQQLQISGSEDVLEETNVVEESKIQSDVTTETNQYQKLIFEEILKQTDVVNGSTMKYQQLQISCSEYVLEETNVMEESKIQSDNTTETNQHIEIRPEEVIEQTNALKDSDKRCMSENDSTLKSQQLEISSSDDVLEETSIIEESKIQSDITTGTMTLEQLSSEGVIEYTNVVKNYNDRCMTENDSTMKSQQLQISRSEDVLEETNVMEYSKIQSDITTETNHHEQLNSEEVIEQTNAVKDDDNRCMSENDSVMQSQQLQISSSEDDLKENNVVKESEIQSDITTETNQHQQLRSEEISEQTVVVKMYMSKNDIVMESQKLQKSNSEDVLEETNVMEVFKIQSDITTGSNQHEQLSSEEVIEQTNAVKDYNNRCMSENDSTIKYQQLQISSSEDVLEETNVVEESKIQSYVTTEIDQYQQLRSEEISEQTVVVKEYMPENDIVIESQKLQISSSEDVLEETNVMEESNIQSDITTGTNQHQQLSSVAVLEQTVVVKEYMSENDFVEESQKLQISSSEDALEETNVMEESITTETNQHKQLRFEEVSEQPDVKDDDNKCMSENDYVMESQKLKIPSSEDVLEETNVVEESKIQCDITTETNDNELLNSEEVIEQTNAIKDDDNRCMSENDSGIKYLQLQISSSEDVLQETNVIEESKIHSYITTGTNQHQQLSSMEVSEQTDVVKEYMSEYDYVLESQQSSLEDILEETNLTKESNLKSNFAIETLQVQQFSTEEVVGKVRVDKIHDGELLMPENYIQENELEQCGPEERVFGICNEVKYPKEDFTKRNAEREVTDFGSDSSLPSFDYQHNLDMSLTIVGVAANNLDTSEFCSGSQENKSETPINQLSQTLTDLLDNVDIEDTNDFTSHCDQKMCDALYMPLPGNCENNYSVTENGLQSFMEITMANANVALVELNSITTRKQIELNLDQETNERKESTNNSECSEFPSFCLEGEELTSYSNDCYSDLERVDNKNHELMQQSMSDYVTNLSLKLTIPDPCNFSDVNHADEESQKKCEEQTESVLLMKWPAKYHNDIKMLKQQNHFLSQCSDKKDACINKLKLDNENLLQKLSDLIAQSQDLNQENCMLKNTLKKSKEDQYLIIALKQENTKLLNDLEALKKIEDEFSNFKMQNEEFINTIEKNRLSKESEVNVLKDKIDELEHELWNIGQTVIDFQSHSQEVALLVESIHTKENQIETLMKDKSLLEDKVSLLSTHLETLDEFKQENVKLKDILQLEEEKSQDMENLKTLLDKQNNDIAHQNEKISKLVSDLNEKEHQIQVLFQDRVSLEETVASINQQIEELRKIEAENHQLKSELKEEKYNTENMLVRCQSLEGHISLQVENISKLNSEICEKDYQIETLSNSNTGLNEIVETLKQRLEELKEFEKENEQLKLSLQQRDERLKEIKSLKASLEEQVSNLNAQNELLWSELKVSSAKEQSLYALQEERLLLEEKLSQLKKEIGEISNLKSDNEHLVDELTNKDCEIRNLTADKKKLKSSLVRANDKLNERDAEIEKLSETLQFLDEHLTVLNEKNAELQNSLGKITKQNQILQEEFNYERLLFSENIGGVSEYLSSKIIENSYLAEEIFMYETGDKKLTEELVSLKKKCLEEKFLLENMQSEKESLENSVSSLKETVAQLTKEVNHYKYQCNDMAQLKEENETLAIKINNLHESVVAYEDEKTYILEDMSSLSETLSNLLIDRQTLSEQLKLSSEKCERLTLLTHEKYKLEELLVKNKQDNSALLQSISVLQDQVESVKDKDKIIDELKEFSSGLEIHLSSLNEELMSEISKNQFLSVTLDELERELSQNNEEMIVLQNQISSLTDQLNVAREKDDNLEELVSNLENHISSLNEELMSEIAKNHFLSLENDNIEHQQNEIIEDKLLLENMVSNAVESLKNRLQNTDYVKNRHVSLQAYIDGILLQVSNFESENFKLNHDINQFQTSLQNSNQSLSDLLEAKQNLEIELSTTIEQKLELENKLTMVLAKETHIKTLEEENESLLKVAETHKCCENTKRLLLNEKSSLELQIQTLTKAIEVLRDEQYQSDVKLKENSQLREVMIKEIHSLTGEMWESNVDPLIKIYQKMMKEFLNKEKEVIFLLQSDFESQIKTTQDKIVSLKNELSEKEVLTYNLENEVQECKAHLNTRDTLISCLENELLTAKNKINNHTCEIEEIKLQAEKEKESLIAELNRIQHVETKLGDKISILSQEINCKNNEISQLKIDLDKIQSDQTNLLRLTEEDCGVSKHQKILIDELTTKLNDKQDLISQLSLQLQSKINQVSQLTECLEKKEIETKQYVMRMEEMTPALLKLNAIENEFNVIKRITSQDEEFDIESFVDSLTTYQFVGDIMKVVVSNFVKRLKQLQIANDNLKLELSNKVEVCKSLKAQINDMNEEIKSCKLLYDEDSLQFKEDIAAKNIVIANLTEALEQLKHNACLNADSKTECTEIENMKEELKKLKEKNVKLHSESKKITYLTEMNRKLSWEIEELSRSVKFEKQSYIDLKAKYDLANNQVADLSKKNFQLEDKIDVLERKLENHDVMSSLKIRFPFGINTVDMQVQYLNEKLAEFDHITEELKNLHDEHSSLKHEYEKSKEYIKKQEEKLCKVMKRELELKKQIASNLQTSPDINILKGLKSELLSLFPGESLSLAEVLLKIKTLVGEEKKPLVLNNKEIEDLQQKIEELSQENKDLDSECEMMNKHIKEQEELLASVFKREEELKKLNAELKSQFPNHLQNNVPPAKDINLNELFEIFTEKPASLKDSINLVKHIMNENQTLKEKISESQEEYASLDKECEDMFKAYKEKEKDLADVLKREADSVSVLKNRQQVLENELRTYSEELQVARSQLTTQMSVPAPCQCEQLKSRLSELKVDLAERNAKITALEMQFEADNFPLKKKVADLEKSLDQAKQKINDLKSEVRRYQEQMCDVTVGLRAECERCRSLGTAVDPTLQQQLQAKNKEIQILKALCKTRNQKIEELEKRDGSYKIPRSQRSALKEVKENKTVPSSPTKPSKGGLQ